MPEPDIFLPISYKPFLIENIIAPDYERKLLIERRFVIERIIFVRNIPRKPFDMKTRHYLIPAIICSLILAAGCSDKKTPEFNTPVDVGTVSIPGNFSFDSGTGRYTLTGAGENLWFNKDACLFVYRQLEGDFLLEGEVSFEGEGTNPHRKIGFMIRESLDEDARYADIAIHGDGLTSLQYREKTGDITLEKALEKKSIGPTKIRLVRIGDRLSMRTGSVTLPESDDAALLLDLPENCYVGLYICSHEEDISETGYFDGVTLTQDLPVAKGTAKISIFCDHIETMARQEGISFAQAAEKVRDMGVTGADIRVMQKESVIKTLDSLGFAHSCAITDIPYSNGEMPELEEATIKFMKERGFDKVLLVPGLVPDDFSEEQKDAVRNRIAAFAEKAHGEGLDVLFEDYDNQRSLCYNSDLIDKLLAKAPSSGVVFDTGNFLFAGDDTEQCLTHFIDKVRHVHLKDRVSETDMNCTPAGAGCIPMENILATLKANNYDGWLTIEQYGSRNMLKDAETAYDNIISILNKK